MPNVVHPWVVEGQGKLRFGVATSWGQHDWSAQRDLAQAVDELGYDSLWVMDHPGVFADCWTTLAAYATVTRRVRLGSLVSCVSYRSPWLLARQAIDVDRLSGGRLVLGVGAGWVPNEFALLGMPFPATASRVKRLAETVCELRRLFGSPPFANAGSLMQATPDQLAAAGLAGLAVQPRLPLLVGGAGERVILRLVAEHADACSIEYAKAGTPEEVRHKFEVVRGYCAARGRDPDSLIRGHYLNIFALARSESELADALDRLPPWPRAAVVPGRTAFTLDGLVRYYRSIVAAGARYLTFALVGGDVEMLRLIAERVMPELQCVDGN